MNNAYIAIGKNGNTVGFVGAMNRTEAARKFQRMGISYVAIELA